MSSFIRRAVSSSLITLFIALTVVFTLVFVPEVGAAGDDDKTETVITNIDNTKDSDEQELRLNRAITIDAAKKEAKAAIEEQLSAIIAEEAEAASQAAEEPEETVAEETSAETEAQETRNTSEETQPESSSSATDTTDSSEATYVVGSVSSDYLLDIDDPDPSYSGCAIALSDYDRDRVERVVMREMGSCGFNGMALVAQSIRDAYILGGYTSVDSLISSYGYCISNSLKPSSTCKDVVSYIFDQGGSAVQHRILYFYASNICSSSWHESQHFICSYDYIRFFDRW